MIYTLGTPKGWGLSFSVGELHSLETALKLVQQKLATTLLDKLRPKFSMPIIIEATDIVSGSKDVDETVDPTIHVYNSLKNREATLQVELGLLGRGWIFEFNLVLCVPTDAPVELYNKSIHASWPITIT